MSLIHAINSHPDASPLGAGPTIEARLGPGPHVTIEVEVDGKVAAFTVRMPPSRARHQHPRQLVGNGLQVILAADDLVAAQEVVGRLRSWAA